MFDFFCNFQVDEKVSDGLKGLCATGDACDGFDITLAINDVVYCCAQNYKFVVNFENGQYVCSCEPKVSRT